MSKYNLIDIFEQYKIGSGWTNDFDYDGMLNTGLGTSIDTPIEVLKKIFEDFTDVNYHREAEHLHYAIEAIEIGDMMEAQGKISDFHAEIKKTQGEQGMDMSDDLGAYMASKMEENEAVDLAIEASQEKAGIKEDNIEEMTGETFNKIDGLTNQNLKAQFLDKFSEIYEDMVEAGDLFDASDVIDYLCNEMQAYAVDTKMDAGGMMEEINKIKSVNLREEIGPTGIAISQNQLDNLKKLGAISGLEVTVQDKDGSNVRKVDYTLTNTDFEKGDDDYDYLEEGLKEHFGRFMKDYQ